VSAASVEKTREKVGKFCSLSLKSPHHTGGGGGRSEDGREMENSLIELEMKKKFLFSFFLNKRRTWRDWRSKLGRAGCGGGGKGSVLKCPIESELLYLLANMMPKNFSTFSLRILPQSQK